MSDIIHSTASFYIFFWGCHNFNTKIKTMNEMSFKLWELNRQAHSLILQVFIFLSTLTCFFYLRYLLQTCTATPILVSKITNALLPQTSKMPRRVSKSDQPCGKKKKQVNKSFFRASNPTQMESISGQREGGLSYHFRYAIMFVASHLWHNPVLILIHLLK